MHDRSDHRGRPLPRPFPALVLAAALAAPLSLAATTPAAHESAGPVCDPGLQSPSGDPQAYRLRGDRCEGLYRLRVNSDKLRIRSWTAWLEEYDAGDGRPLRVGWSLPPGADGRVRLRAGALQPRTYYRMDTRLPADAAPWSWPTGFLDRLRLGKADLGLVGWITMSPGDAGERRVYLPLTVRQMRPARPAGYRVALVPGERLLEVTWTLVPVDDAGRLEPPLTAERDLGYGYYPSRRPTVFTVPAPAEPGLYLLRVEARLRTGGRAVRELWFYHPGAPGAGEAS